MPTVHQRDFNNLSSIKLYTPEKPTLALAEPAPVAPAKPVPAVYTVVSGDSLSKIGLAHSVEWRRIYAKNTHIAHPDRINVGDKLTIPLADEQLHRDLPAAPVAPVAPQPSPEPVLAAPAPVAAVQAPAPQPEPVAYYDASNTYYEGYCTWYVKNRRGSTLPNTLGNANTWYSRAAAQGMAVGTVPKAGAVGTTERGEFGHVVYVESVNADGSITISEMNYAGLYSQRTRTANASEFRYIY